MTILYERVSGGSRQFTCPHPAKLCNRSAVPGFESCPLGPTITAQFRDTARINCKTSGPG